MATSSTLPRGSEPPKGFEPWCTTLRGDQTWLVESPGGARALDTWRALRNRHSRTGLWPVLLGGDRQAADQLTWRLDMMSRNQPGIPALADVPLATDLFLEWMGDPADDDYLNDVPRHLARLEQDAAGIKAHMDARPDEDAVQSLGSSTALLALVPALGGWEVPALLAWAGAEGDGVDGGDHLSVLHFWHEQNGAELVALGLERMELLVDQPPDDARSAFGLAVQHYAYCPKLMDNLVPAIGALAATLFGRHWLFDWS